MPRNSIDKGESSLVSDSGTLKVGMVNFVNTSPVMVPFSEMKRPEFLHAVEDVPTKLNSMLLQEQLDAGMVSSFFYGQHHQELEIVSEFCISATGTVGSVILFSTVPIYELSGRHIALTTQSATSINLLYIILEHFNMLEPHYITGDFNLISSGEADGYLAIGDEALKLNCSNRSLYSYDLASIWYGATSLPFVFAVWAAKKETFQAKRRLFKRFDEILIHCYQQGQNNLSTIAAKVCGKIPMPSYECLSYLKGIEFHFTPEKERGLQHFFRLLYHMGKLPEIPDLSSRITKPREEI